MFQNQESAAQVPQDFIPAALLPQEGLRGQEKRKSWCPKGSQTALAPEGVSHYIGRIIGLRLDGLVCG